MDHPFFQVDAFTDELFGGNPAGVCPLNEWPADDILQAVAAENNLSETAYFCAEGDGTRLRWFTPTVEVELCGHATLAAAHVILSELEPAREGVLFQTLSGALDVKRAGDGLLAMNFPALAAMPQEPPTGLLAALGGSKDATVLRAGMTATGNYLVVYQSESEVRALAPDFAALIRALAGERAGVIATAQGGAPGDSDGAFDFVSRYFAPNFGVPEDPVTGSAHSTLVPYWGEALGRKELVARQVSARGGILWCTDLGEHVELRGRCVTYLRGTISLP